MPRDIDAILKRWTPDDEPVNARVITGVDGVVQLQLRLDCGILQMHLDGRPDGTTPHGCSTYLEYIEERMDGLNADDPIELSQTALDRMWSELDREMTQYYYRRLALLAVAREIQEIDGDEARAALYYEQAVIDAEHTLRAMDFIRDNCEDDEHIEVHERFRPFVLWHRTVGMTHKHVIEKDFDEAVEEIKTGMGQIAQVYEDHGLTKWLKHDPSMAELKELEKRIRKDHGIASTLNEQLEQALGKEDYEKAASIRDQLKAKGKFAVPHAPAMGRGVRF